MLPTKLLEIDTGKNGGLYVSTFGQFTHSMVKICTCVPFIEPTIITFSLTGKLYNILLTEHDIYTELLIVANILATVDILSAKYPCTSQKIRCFSVPWKGSIFPSQLFVMEIMIVEMETMKQMPYVTVSSN